MKKFFYLFSVALSVALISSVGLASCDDDEVTSPDVPGVIVDSVQTHVCFVNEADTVLYADGDTLFIYGKEEDGEVILEAPTLYNPGKEEVSVKLVYNVVRLPEGTKLADCLSGGCQNRTKVGTYDTKAITLAAGAKTSSLIEWNCFTNKGYVKDFCTVVFDIYEDEVKSSQITVVYVNGDVDLNKDSIPTSTQDTITIGHVLSDTLPSEGGSIYRYIGHRDSVVVGSIIPQKLYSSMSDGKIVSIRFGVACDVEANGVFVYSLAEGRLSLVAYQPIKGKSAKAGWNTVMFDKPVDLPKSKDMMIAYSYYEDGDKAPVLLDENVMVDGGCYFNFVYNSNLAWYDFSSNGALCIQCNVASSMIPEFDVKMSSLVLPSSMMMVGQEVKGSFMARNFGLGEVESYRFDVMLDDQQVSTVAECNVGALSASDAIFPIKFTLPNNLSRGVHTVTVKASEINGKALVAGTEDDVLTAHFSAYMAEDKIERQRYLIEEFTSNSCTYCPLGAAVIEEIEKQYADKVCVACIHGNLNSKDPFNDDNNAALLDYLGSNSYPTGALNRMYEPESGSLSFGLGYYEAAEAAPEIYSYLENGSIPAFASVDIKTELDGSDLKISVAGKGKTNIKSVLDGFALTVYVLEDGLVYKQFNQGNWVNDYVHNHVIRAVPTAINGDLVNWISDTEYSHSYNVALDEQWKVEKMSVIAFLSKQQPLAAPDFCDMAVSNANEVKLVETSVSNNINMPHYAPSLYRPSLNVNAQKQVGVLKIGQKMNF